MVDFRRFIRVNSSTHGNSFVDEHLPYRRDTLAGSSTASLTMGAIYRHLTDNDAQIFKKELAIPGLNLSVGCRTALADFAGGSINSFADVKKKITNVRGLWLNPMVDAATSASDFDLRQLRKRLCSERSDVASEL